MIDYSVDSDGIATLSWNMPEPVNLLTPLSLEEFARRSAEAIADPRVRGVVITSSKPQFIAGADLKALLHDGHGAALRNLLRVHHQALRNIETSGKPFVAAINGTALGGGYEICLACHHRIAADHPKAQIGLPEVQVGLMPGLGGTQRLPRLIGIHNALPLLLEGKRLRPGEAKAAGLVDAVAPHGELLATARSWILSHADKKAVQPWDSKGFRIPGGPSMERGGHAFGAASAALRERTLGLYPAPLAILSSVFEGCQVELDAGLKIESRYFVHVLGTPEARNLIRLFFSRQELDSLAARPAHVPAREFAKIGVLGAGMMGSGIAYACAAAGMAVVLLDTTLEIAERGRAAAASIFEKQVGKGQLAAGERDKAIARIRATSDYAALQGCELMIEAVFEDRAIKAEVTRKTEEVLGAEIVFASNTSTLPITGLAQAWSRPDNFIGLHFFSPVDKMPLLEIIRGKQTSEACLARAMDLARRIRKTPIVVNDSRGFYTSRVFSTYLNEGLSMLLEGIAPALIENAGRMAGMPVGPLVLADEVSLDLMRHVREQTRADLGAAHRANATDEVLRTMIDRCGRHSKKAGGGFYEYPEGAKKHLWPDLAKWFPSRDGQPDVSELIQRFRYVQSLETVRCMEEGVVTDPRDADVGSVLGWGFCPALGGTVSHIDTVGIPKFMRECERLEQAYGKRFAVPALLREKARAGESFCPQARKGVGAE